ncbi:6320_t:CDS:2 [Paraglomus brasilianum]|uniref:Glycerol-3-phosphate dehydrogenase n=1 Tax=Paraglomus brasilianum TaxID=144538 RepID=A0A9N9GGF9_9GLOM|nr:6320_t:CDS:2 [Paraglomus brasilianum]
MFRAFSRKRVFVTSALTATAATSYYYYNKNSRKHYTRSTLSIPNYRLTPDYLLPPSPDPLNYLFAEGPRERPATLWTPPSRKDMLNLLKGLNKDGSIIEPKYDADSQKTKSEPPFDLLIIGGGATGAGSALDAASRGLRVALVERDDFACGTSSKSTKLVHGGVRYLEKAMMEFDYEQYKLVKEALHERSIFLHTAPYLSVHLPIMIPLDKRWKIPYYWVGLKAYELLAGRENVEPGYFLTKTKALEAFPMLKKDKIVGALVYYDGQHNDARMNVALALTAITYGAVIANHVEVTRLLKDENGIVSGAHVKDILTGEEWDVKAKGVINATGPFTDSIRKMDNPTDTNIVAPSSGVHIVLPNYYSPGNMGLIDPSTSDGRVIFFLPWEGNTIAGTTDSPTVVTYAPQAREEEVQWILDEIKRYLSPDVKVRRGDVLASWSGIRPLVRDPSAKNTAELVRNHMINVSESKMITIAGGKWTTYRAMAQDTIDKAIEVYGLEPTHPCRTEEIRLIGSHGYSKTMFIKLIQQFGLDTEVAQHLANSYGDRAWGVATLSQPTGKRWPVFGKRLSPSFPYIESEVHYAARREYACTVVDVIARRTRLAFLNAQATLESLPRIIEIMTEELGWSKNRMEQEFSQAVDFLMTMGLPKPKEKLTLAKFKAQLESHKHIESEPLYSRARFQPEELVKLQNIFSELDVNGDGQINAADLKKVLTAVGVSVPDYVLEDIIEEVDLHKHGAIEFEEFLEVMSGVKEIQLQNAFASIVEQYTETKWNQKIPPGRAGGGV